MCQRLIRAALSTALAAAATAQETPVDTIPWTPRNQLAVTATTRLESIRGDTVRLMYSLQSHPTSVQSGEVVFLQRYVKSWVVSSPARWVGDSTMIGESTGIAWFTFEDTGRIDAGENLTGFSIVGVGVPDLVSLRVLGYVPAAVGDGSSDVEYEDPPSIWDDAAAAMAVGIVRQPSGFALDLLNRLSTLASRVCELAWVSPVSTCSSLSARLSVAGTALANGQNGTARSEIDAYIADLEDRRGGEVSESAYALLWPNARGLRARL
jgi:hypothetical protein